MESDVLGAFLHTLWYDCNDASRFLLAQSKHFTDDMIVFFFNLVKVFYIVKRGEMLSEVSVVTC